MTTEAAPFPRPAPAALALSAGWLVLALVLGTHQWVELRGTGKELGWAQAVLWQATSWLLLAAATPFLFASVSRAPLRAGHPERVRRHLLGALLFGVAFLVVGVPLRLAFHPSPLRWSFFGEAFYKSVPQFVLLGAAAYALTVLVASFLEARAALETEPEREPAPDPARRVALETRRGTLHLRTEELVCVTAADGGARVRTAEGETFVLHPLAELEERLAPAGFLRTHRAVLVNLDHVREVLGGASRDGSVRLSSGEDVRLSRRRRAELVARLEARDA